MPVSLATRRLERLPPGRRHRAVDPSIASSGGDPDDASYLPQVCGYGPTPSGTVCRTVKKGSQDRVGTAARPQSHVAVTTAANWPTSGRSRRARSSSGRRRRGDVRQVAGGTTAAPPRRGPRAARSASRRRGNRASTLVEGQVDAVPAVPARQGDRLRWPWDGSHPARLAAGHATRARPRGRADSLAAVQARRNQHSDRRSGPP